MATELIRIEGVRRSRMASSSASGLQDGLPFHVLGHERLWVCLFRPNSVLKTVIPYIYVLQSSTPLKTRLPQHLNVMSGLPNREEEEIERTIAQFTAVVRDLNTHRARGRGRRPGRVIAESITLDDSSDEEIHSPTCGHMEVSQ